MHRAAAVVCLLATVACTHHQKLTYLGELADKDELSVELAGGRGEADIEAVAQNNRTGEYGLRIENGGVVTFDEIKSVTEIRRGRGALEGLGIGAAIGAGGGIVLGIASGDDECMDDGSHSGGCFLTFTATEKAILGGILLGGLGGLVGIIAGGIVGSRYVYTADSSTTPRFVPTGPPGSAAGITLRF